jgi:hypothetical protein
VHGEQGNCHSVVPTTAAAVSLNVTAVGASTATYLTVYPAGAELPTTSNLNPGPGLPPIPNAVTTDLSDGGQFNVFNKYGNVNVIIDVVGYFEDHNHDDRYYTEEEVNAAIAAAVSAPNHITGDMVVDDSLSLYDLAGSSSRIKRINFTPNTFSVPAQTCIARYLSFDSSDAVRMVIPYAIGRGIPSSALLSASPVVLNISGGGTFVICNGSTTTAFTTTSNVDMEYSVA